LDDKELITTLAFAPCSFLSKLTNGGTLNWRAEVTEHRMSNAHNLRTPE